jgi:hypothetical protein
MKDKIPSLLNPFHEEKASGKNNMLLPDCDCIAMAMVYKGCTYGGYVNVDFNNSLKIDRTFEFLTKSGRNQIKKLKEKKC